MRKLLFDKVEETIGYSIDIGIAHLSDESPSFNGKNMTINNNKLVGFQMCDYLGLSVDERLKEAAIEATRNYGVFTSVSRTYLKLKIYKDAEDAISEYFGSPTILMSRTSLAHIAAIPVVTDTDDALIADHHVHTSVRNAIDLCRGYGNYVETIRHNNIEKLEERIIELSKKHENVWYFADGVYSMHGDIAPIHEIYSLLDKYEKFHLYIDDAHGMSWYGKKGIGTVLGQIPMHDKMIVATSFAKGFGSGGAAIIRPNEKTKKRLLVCGPPLIFSGPLVPATLGALMASIEIHSSDNFTEMQRSLARKINLFHEKCDEFNLPIIQRSDSPIMFIAAGKPDMAADLCRVMLDYNYHVTGGVYPAVPINNSGLRLLVSLLHRDEEIIDMLTHLKFEYDKAMEKRKINLDKIMKFYKE